MYHGFALGDRLNAQARRVALEVDFGGLLGEDVCNIFGGCHIRLVFSWAASFCGIV